MTARIQPITMPKWGIEMQEGTITAWHAVVGQHVAKGDTLLDVETEKIVNSVESPASGKLRRIVAASGETCAVGALIAVFAEDDVPADEVDAFIAAFRPADASFEPDAAATPVAQAVTAAAASAGDDGESRVSPIARKLADRLGIDVRLIKGTGRNGRVSKDDVEAYAARLTTATDAAAAPVAPAAPMPPTGLSLVENGPTREKLTSMRLTIARRLTESSQQIPHYRLAVDVDTGAIAARRLQLKADGLQVSLNDLLVRAVALALVQHPDVNAHYAGDEVLRFPHADVCIAVATPTGLLTPVLREADTKSLREIAAESRSLAERAKDGRLTRDEITGGTFTISNLGMYGIDRFDAIINPPQVGILAVGAAQERVVVRGGAVVAARIMTLTLSADHRIVDGAVGAQFLATLRSLIEAPDLL